MRHNNWPAASFFEEVERWASWAQRLHRIFSHKLPFAERFPGRRFNPGRRPGAMAGRPLPAYCYEDLMSDPWLWEMVAGEDAEQVRCQRGLAACLASATFAEHLCRFEAEIAEWIVRRAGASDRGEDAPDRGADWDLFFKRFGLDHGFAARELHGCNSLAAALSYAIDECAAAALFEERRTS